jgi:hypothetical protein
VKRLLLRVIAAVLFPLKIHVQEQTLQRDSILLVADRGEVLVVVVANLFLSRPLRGHADVDIARALLAKRVGDRVDRFV